MSDWWVAISKMETAYPPEKPVPYKSPLFLNNNNAFGFTYTVNDPYNDGYTVGSQDWAKYKSVSDSARAIVDYMERFNYPDNFASIDALIQFMGSKGYFGKEPASSYLAKVKNFL